MTVYTFRDYGVVSRTNLNLRIHPEGRKKETRGVINLQQTYTKGLLSLTLFLSLSLSLPLSFCPSPTFKVFH